MSNWGLISGASDAERCGSGSGSTGTQVAPDTTQNVKGAWVQLIASTARKYGSIALDVSSVGPDAEFMFDIGYGSAGNEVVLLPNLCAPNLNSSNGLQATGLTPRIYVPIPAGSRIVARSQCSVGAQGGMRHSIWGFPDSNLSTRGIGRATTYGSNTAASRGTIVDGGGTANTKGAYVQLDAATAYPIKQMYLFFDAGGSVAGTRVSATFLMDVAVGAAASETVILKDLPVLGMLNDCLSPWCAGPFDVNIPAGVRLAARTQSSSNSAVSRIFGLSILALG